MMLGSLPVSLAHFSKQTSVCQPQHILIRQFKRPLSPIKEYSLPTCVTHSAYAQWRKHKCARHNIGFGANKPLLHCPFVHVSAVGISVVHWPIAMNIRKTSRCFGF